jgi:YceI-like domain
VGSSSSRSVRSSVPTCAATPTRPTWSLVTRPVTLALDVNGFTRDPYGDTRAGFSATTELDRGDFDITTNIPMDGGGVVIGDRIQVFIEIEAVRNPPRPASP